MKDSASQLKQGGITCAFCDSCKIHKIMDFGNVALAGAFLKPDDFTDEKLYPLRLFFCEDCYALQVVDQVDPKILFKNYFYCSSSISTLRTHFENYAECITKRFNPTSVVEIGCNDGVLLRPLEKRVEKVIGVDPANIANGLNIINDFFSEKVAHDITREHGLIDLVIANNVYAHIQDIQGVTRAIRDILKPDGVFVFEVHSLSKMIELGQYDWVYHEHLYYYSLLSLEKHFERYGMRIFDVENTGLHAGSRRYYVCKDDHQVSDDVEEIRQRELRQGLDSLKTFQYFAENADQQKTALMSLLNDIRSQGKKIVGYGACGRANTMIQYCGITHEHMEYIIDDAPAKHGFFTPGSHFEVKPRTDNIPDYILVFAWSFLADIIPRCVADLIIPLPNVHIRRID